MNIVYISPEVAPFAKTGGLADVAGSLPKALESLGHDVSVFMPFYRQAKEYFDDGGAEQTVIDTGVSVSVPIATRRPTADVFEARLPGSGVRLYLIRNDAYFDRSDLYTDSARHADYADNCERFVFFSRAALEAAEVLGLQPGVIHCNDWQTGLVPAYVRTLYGRSKAVAGARTVFTIHNLAYQGVFPQSDMKLTGLDSQLFNWKQLEFYGQLNCLKGGLVFADILSTVSRRYAQEIQTEEFGCGLEGVLKERSADLHGVVNGIDCAVWNPEIDGLISATYSATDFSGKAACKAALLRSQGLPESNGTPLIGIISRLAAQKGFDILEMALDEMMKLDLQVVMLGTGEKKYHRLFEAAAAKYPDKLAANLTFSNRLAHEIEAGCDMFLMPSRYEPCGLNQLYSLKYGTVPVVRATGGLADTIVDCNGETIAGGTATGFAFDTYSPAELLSAIERALDVYARPEDWSRLVTNGMAQDWSWRRSAREYERLYEQALTGAG